MGWAKRNFMKININKKEAVVIACIGAAVIFVFPWLFVQPTFFPSFAGKGEIGDTIGGITAPFLSFFGSVLVYLALKSQIDANEEFKKQFKRQNYDQLFFRLMDKLNEKVKTFEINDGTRDLKSYESLGYLVKGLKERVIMGVPNVLKEYLLTSPEEVEIQTYKVILEVLQPYNDISELQAKELKNLFVKAQNEHDRKVLYNQYVIGSNKKEKLKEEGKILLYIRQTNVRHKLYNDISERLFNRCGAFLDAYVQNLVYLIQLINQEEANEFYIEYLKGNLSDHEKAILYYYLFGKSANNTVRIFFRRSEVLSNFDYRRYTNVPNEILFEKELEMLLN